MAALAKTMQHHLMRLRQFNPEVSWIDPDHG